MLSGVFAVGIAEDHGNTPQTCHADQRVDDAADGAHLAAEQKCHAVKAEKAYAAPVQRDFINDFQNATSLK